MKPKLIDLSCNIELIESMENSVYPTIRATFLDLDSKGWKFYPVKQHRGRCYYAAKTITIPVWAILKGAEYATYYIAHEMAHAYCPWQNHNIVFMTKFKTICPQHLWHYEIDYKPRNAIAAGITDKDIPT